jgi:two-component system cell cycle sensor histidine kinase/response regulator CckA
MPLRILLVDDDDDVRDYTAYVLEDAGYEVRVASRGEVALQLLASGEPFDLLITDIVMPGWDGPELVRRVKEVRTDLRILYITGFPRHVAPARFADAEILDKPFQREKLLNTVRHVLTRGVTGRELPGR